ncbi:MAG: TfoX/Sxy family protein [Geminicoccaceae bacterium]
MAEGFVAFVVEQLEPLGGVRARRMFGGWGLMRGERMFGLIAGDRLYFKVDPVTRPQFEAAGCEPFVYGAKTRTVALPYLEAPAESLDDAEAMLAWARLAVEAAQRTAPAKPRRPDGTVVTQNRRPRRRRETRPA